MDRRPVLCCLGSLLEGIARCLCHLKYIKKLQSRGAASRSCYASRHSSLLPTALTSTVSRPTNAASCLHYS